MYKGTGGNKLNKNKLSLLKDTIIGFLILAIIGYAFIWLLRLLLDYVGNFIKSLSNMDAVVIVALITGSVSILGVVISSIVSKLIEYQQKDIYMKKRKNHMRNLLRWCINYRIARGGIKNIVRKNC